ncbi:protein of unknown function [Blastococcus saxobsidens DD2]|uniref:Uncharacterized protein n=1 Tax=Blastococcus saxobsidens (strain DD2) TaxID=1146883 RepID=H6RUI0_BLASD|nr:protein of unknown function [Blastococcus saxobsidens DD2]
MSPGPGSFWWLVKVADVVVEIAADAVDGPADIAPVAKASASTARNDLFIVPPSPGPTRQPGGCGPGWREDAAPKKFAMCLLGLMWPLGLWPVESSPGVSLPSQREETRDFGATRRGQVEPGSGLAVFRISARLPTPSVAGWKAASVSTGGFARPRPRLRSGRTVERSSAS